KITNEELDELLTHDSLAIAETITGHSYKDDDETGKLGLAINMLSADAKRKVLKSRNDTWFSMKMAAYLDVIKGLGFEKIHEYEFIRRSFPDKKDIHQLWYRYKDGLLLACDSFEGQRNGAKLFYNWKPNDNFKHTHTILSSGQYHSPAVTDIHDDAGWQKARKEGNMFWVGDHDAREAIVRIIERLEKNGSFVKKWVKRPWMSLGFYSTLEYKDSDTFNTSNNTKDEFVTKIIAELPEEVRNNIGTEE
ncbi:unnamed protein product, partial [marine sediment metagenome]